MSRLAGGPGGRAARGVRAGVLAPADVHVARRLGALTGETDERVLLAAALTVRGTRHGSVVLDLATAADTITPDVEEDDPDSGPVELPWPEPVAWAAACAASPLVTGAADGPPLQMVDTLAVARPVLAAGGAGRRRPAQAARRPAGRPRRGRAAGRPGRTVRGRRRPARGRRPRRAVAVSASSPAGRAPARPPRSRSSSPCCCRRLGPELRIALAAPTGKAAARLEEAVHAAAGRLSEADRAAPRGAVRVHAAPAARLAARRVEPVPARSHNHLPYDVVIVDESSMVSLTLMARLLEALAPGTRLVLVGDPDQLASVEAGAVLGDLVDSAPLPRLGRPAARPGATG